jgi:hypothetical protein
MIWKIAGASVLLVAMTVPAFGQTRCSLPPASPSGAGPIDGPSSQGNAGMGGASVELGINNDLPSTTVSLGKKFAPVWCVDPDNRTRFRQTALGISVSVPIGGKDNLTEPATLDKLSNGASMTASLSVFGFSSRPDPGPLGARPGFGWQATLEGEVGLKSFDYRDVGTLAYHSDDKVPFAIGGAFAFFPAPKPPLDGQQPITGARSSMRLGVTYQHAYEAKKEKVLCKPTVADPSIDCMLAAPGAPDRDKGLLLKGEYRRTFPIGWDFADIAVAPITTYDALNDEFGVELPIYLLPFEKSSVLPGIKIGYSTTNDVTFGLFIKQAFDF